MVIINAHITDLFEYNVQVEIPHVNINQLQREGIRYMADLV